MAKVKGVARQRTIKAVRKPKPLHAITRRNKLLDSVAATGNPAASEAPRGAKPSPASFVLSTPTKTSAGKKPSKKKTKQAKQATMQRERHMLQSLSIEELQSRLAKYGTNSLAGQVLAAMLVARRRRDRGTQQSGPVVEVPRASKPKKKQPSPSKTGRVAGYREDTIDPLRPWSDKYEMPEYDFE